MVCTYFVKNMQQLYYLLAILQLESSFLNIQYIYRRKAQLNNIHEFIRRKFVYALYKNYRTKKLITCREYCNWQHYIPFFVCRIIFGIIPTVVSQIYSHSFVYCVVVLTYIIYLLTLVLILCKHQHFKQILFACVSSS